MKVMGQENHVRKVTRGVGEDSSEGLREMGMQRRVGHGEEPDSVR